MFTFTKVFGALALLASSVAYAGNKHKSCEYTLEDFAGHYVSSYSSNAGIDCCRHPAAQTFISHSTQDCDGAGQFNFISAAILDSGFDYVRGANPSTLSSNAGFDATAITFQSVLTYPELGAGYLVLLDYPIEGQYVVLDYIGYSTHSDKKVTDIVLNGGGDPTDADFEDIIGDRVPSSPCNAPNLPVSIGVTHAVKQKL